MDVLLSLLLGGLLGALAAAWASEYLRRRDRFVTGLFVLQSEIARNLQMMHFIRHPEEFGGSDREKDDPFEVVGTLFEMRAWHEYGPSIGFQIAKRDMELWGDLMGAYMLFETFSISHGGSIDRATFDDDLMSKVDEISDRLARMFPLKMSMNYFRLHVLPLMTPDAAEAGKPVSTWEGIYFSFLYVVTRPFRKLRGRPEEGGPVDD